MQAIVFSRYGTPDALQLTEVPKPLADDHDVLVKVYASSVNSWDWEFMSGRPLLNRLLYGLFRPKTRKQVLGADIAGRVESVGRKVSRFRPGDEVFGDLWDNWGGFAQYACAHETALEAKPVNLSFEQAAAVPQAGVLALQGLRKAGQIQPGEQVLINGAGGGVGTFALQLARLCGAEVTAVDAAAKLRLLRSVGADHIVDYTREDFSQTGKTYDLIIDCRNVRSMFANRRALKPGGTYAMVGGSMTGVYQLWLLSLLGRLTHDDRKLCLVAEGPNQGLAELRELIESGKILPVVDRIYPLSQVPQALAYFGRGQHRGKIVISIRQ